MTKMGMTAMLSLMRVNNTILSLGDFNGHLDPLYPMGLQTFRVKTEFAGNQ